MLFYVFFSTGEALHNHLHKIIPALIGSLETMGESGIDESVWQAAKGVVLSVKVHIM